MSHRVALPIGMIAKEIPPHGPSGEMPGCDEAHAPDHSLPNRITELARRISSALT